MLRQPSADPRTFEMLKRRTASDHEDVNVVMKKILMGECARPGVLAICIAQVSKSTRPGAPSV